jgi:Holliday junction resolvase RusA-like endonuclease
MKNLVDIYIPGKVIPNNTKHWLNPKTKKVISYKPKKVTHYRQAIKMYLKQYCLKNNVQPVNDIPVELQIYTYIAPPKSYSKKKRENLIGKYVHVKPDADNIQKLVQDAISKNAGENDFYLIYNDSLVSRSFSEKVYAKEDGLRLIVNLLSPARLDTILIIKKPAV